VALHCQCTVGLEQPVSSNDVILSSSSSFILRYIYLYRYASVPFPIVTESRARLCICIIIRQLDPRYPRFLFFQVTEISAGAFRIRAAATGVGCIKQLLEMHLRTFASTISDISRPCRPHPPGAVQPRLLRAPRRPLAVFVRALTHPHPTLATALVLIDSEVGSSGTNHVSIQVYRI
jgi:hypothetical protein